MQTSQSSAETRAGHCIERFSYVVKLLKCDESCRLGFCSDSSLELDTFVYQIADLPNPL